MNAKQKKFVTEKLIPFILREQGRGFAMETWIEKDGVAGETFESDGVVRQIPKCNTVACIGGSTCVLSNLPPISGTSEVGEKLGLSHDRAETLFYGANADLAWLGDTFKLWPKKYLRRYEKSTTALGKAKVAVALLREVVATDGKILDAGEYIETE